MKQTSNPLRKFLHSFRSQQRTTRDTKSNSRSECTSDSGLSSLDDYEEESRHQSERQKALSQHDPLLPHLLSAVKDYQLTHGSLVKLLLHPSITSLPIPHTVLARPIGVSLVPTLWPKERFDEAWPLQTVLQELYARVASDPEYLYEALRDAIESEDDDGYGSEKWGDAIVTGLWKVYEAVKDDPDGLGYAQDLEIGLCRGDWMLDIDGPAQLAEACPSDENGPDNRRLTQRPKLKQVEFNAIATAGVSHTSIVYDMHRHLLKSGLYSCLASHSSSTFQASNDPASEHNSNDTTSLPYLPPDPVLPPHNTSMHGFTHTLARAHSLYGPPKCPLAHRTAVLMVVQHSNVNIADERPIEYALWDLEPSVPCFRCEYRDILEVTWFAERDEGRGVTGRELLFSPFKPDSSHPRKYHSTTAHSSQKQPPSTPTINTTFEISLIYLRSSLSAPELSGHGLLTRLHIERSRAIKCPSVLGQLAACKRVQWHLGLAGVMERFISKEAARRVRERQMGMESLGDADGELRRTLDHAVSVMSKNSPAVVKGARLRQKPGALVEAEEVCSRFVLKPIAAEGGSHCVFGSSIPAFYAEQIAPRSSQAGYVLMQRIHPPVVKGALISQRGYHVGNVVSELGILGGVIFRRTRTGDSKKKRERGAEESELKKQQEGASSETREITTDTVPKSNVDIIINEALGWTLKSKSEDVPEMSVIKGYGCFDTPCLIDWETYLVHARGGRIPGVEDIVDRRTET